MAEESSTPDLSELARRADEAINHGDLDAWTSFFAPDAVWDLSTYGIGPFEGRAAIRSVVEDLLGSFEDFEQETEEARYFGNGVTLGIYRQRARPAGSSGYVQQRYAIVAKWNDGLVERATNYGDIDEARAAAERLAESRG